MRRALKRADDGKTLDPVEAEILLGASGDALTALMATAARVRDQGLADAGRSGIITYSKKVFIPLTRLCRDRCHYCTFATTPGRVHAPYLSPDEVLEIARQGAALGCKEALFTLGDAPEDRWDAARQWLEEAGYDSTLDYVRAMAIRVLEETGLLPHLNPGVMSWQDLQRLKPVAPSMGMMLETTSRRLFEEKGQPHFGSPDKDPAIRLRVLEDAGRSNVPFTTGLLIGIGENLVERADSIFALRRVARQYNGIQEVIIQGFRVKPDTAMRNDADVPLDEWLAAIAVTRIVLGPRVRVQAPPNLVDLAECRALLDAGVDDFGGVSPLTPDHVNPERPWPQIDDLAKVTADAGFVLRERLTAHPEYLREPWLDPRLISHVEALLDPATGLADESAMPAGLPWQEPDGGWDSVGRTDLHTAIDTEGRRTETRSDFDAAYGDWDVLREDVAARRAAEAAAAEGAAAAGDALTPPGATSPERISAEVKAALAAAERDPAGLSDAQALTLMTVTGPALDQLARIADNLRKATVGDDVTYVVNRNINFTNVCYTGCRFCAFAQRRTDADAYSLSMDEVGQRAEEAWVIGATEVCMQGGIHPDLPGTAYADLVRAVKDRVPEMHVHAYSPMEIVNGSVRTGLSIEEFLISVKEAGLDSIPGTAAEILDDDVRWILTKGKLPTASWIEVISTAHKVGLPSSSTMMYGHVDAPHHWVQHLRTIAAVQDQTGGFTEFVLLPFIHQNSPIYLAGVARPGPTYDENRAVHAMSRIMLHGRIDNIQCSWVKLGVDGCVAVLNGGVNDIGGTLMEETISRMAGSKHGSRKSIAELTAMATAAGRPARQRTTTYGDVPARPSLELA
ncbi:FO synthase subunit 1 /FO synthase subunit 2 [Kribbella kalugense]|uniref:FO synthase n=2 Tax=Kribbella kalugense TaxID=2512221 RepID=A0A4R7ZJM0_9ACTN|nr:FO synthase subunit 1 /FO synthase subunit 2 [Kribbella kalugense]